MKNGKHPNPNTIHPIAGYDREIYVKPTIRNPNILVGEFTYIADSEFESQSARRFTDTPMWNATLSARVWPMVQAKKDTPEYLYFSPLEADSFHGLPPAYIETAEFDCLHDDGILYAQKLRETGTPVVLNETRGTMHGFDIVHRAKTTRAALAARVAFIRQHFSIE